MGGRQVPEYHPAPSFLRRHKTIRAPFVDDAPDGWLAMLEATLAHGLCRKTIMKNIKTVDLQAVYVRTVNPPGFAGDSVSWEGWGHVEGSCDVVVGA